MALRDWSPATIHALGEALPSFILVFVEMLAITFLPVPLTIRWRRGRRRAAEAV